MKFKYNENDLKYSPGDILMVRPVNPESSIEKFFELFKENKNIKLDPTTLINVTQRNNDMPIPHNLCKPLNLYQCAKYYWDLNVNIFILYLHYIIF